MIILAVKVEQFLEGEEHRLKLRSATALNLKSLEVHSMGMAHGNHKKIKDGQLYVKLDHEMTRDHDLECITLCTCQSLHIVKLDPE